MKALPTLAALAVLLALASPARSAGEEPDEGWRRFTDFVHETYLWRIAWRVVKSDVSEGAPRALRNTERTKLAEEEVERLLEDPQLLFRLYGYAIGNQLARARKGSLPELFAKDLERQYRALIPHYAGLTCGQASPPAEDLKSWTAKLDRVATSAVSGDFDDEMIRRTRFTPATAPDFLDHHFGGILVKGRWEMFEVTDAEESKGRGRGIWELRRSAMERAHDARRIDGNAETRKWRIIDGLLFWFRADGTPDAVFFVDEDQCVGTPLNETEREEFAENGFLVETPGFGARSTLTLHRAMDPDDPAAGVVGEWDCSPISGDPYQGENRLRIRIEAVPGRPGHYRGVIVDQSAKLDESYPGGRGMEIIRLLYQKGKSDLKRALYFDVQTWSRYLHEEGRDPWKPQKWARITDDRMTVPNWNSWLRR